MKLRWMLAILLTSASLLLAIGCEKDEPEPIPVKLDEYANDRGIGFFYPPQDAVMSGIAQVHGLAYTGEGWLEEDRGVGKVVVRFGEELELEARTYVKNRYWIRTFDTSAFEDGPLAITVTAYDLTGALIGTAVNRVTIDNGKSNVGNRYYASPDGLADGDGSKAKPWDTTTATGKLVPGDVLFLLGGQYGEPIVVDRSGAAGKPITIMNVPGEVVELKGAGIDIAYETEHVTIMGIDQSSLRGEDYGVELAARVKHIAFWDCSFNDNTYPYEQIEEQTHLEYGTGFHAGMSGNTPEDNRHYITISHSEAKFNDADGFHLSSIDHGRFQYLESAWNPNGKTADIFQYKHANGFVSKNSEYERWGYPSADNVYLFCYSHHNGQDGWDLRSPHASLFGVVTHDEAQAGHQYGGVGIKLWEYDYAIVNAINFRNNLIDGSGGGLILAGEQLSIRNSLFYGTTHFAVSAPKDARVASSNNIFSDYIVDFTSSVASSNSIFHGVGKPPAPGTDSLTADPLFLNAEQGNFFLRSDSPAIDAGSAPEPFVVDGIDYSRFDALGRPLAAGSTQVGPYARYDGADATPYVAPTPIVAAAGPALNPDTFAGIPESLDVRTAPIRIDGALDDWNGVESYEVAVDTEGKPLTYKHLVAFAWDGGDTLYAQGTITGPGELKAEQRETSESWWTDDVFELFLVPELPYGEADNRTAAIHYGLNRKHLFEASGLSTDAIVASLPAEPGKWSFEAEFKLNDAMRSKLEKDGAMYAKAGIELNSYGEFSLLGRTGGYWDADNYIKLTFVE
ncbi:hypothetical protein [Cohnella sp. GCM10027633]|uniref:hypothetical protein n=1 Tax=unclassified Cohnella TaxID=2636738 RepID=UPI0036459C0B